MNLVAIRTLKRIDPDAHFTFLLNGNYRAAAPLFIDQPDIDQIHITHSPIGDLDETDLKWLGQGRFHHVFSLMADHNHSDPWWFKRNQPQEVNYIHGIPIPADEKGKLSLNRWFNINDSLRGYVALQAFAGSYDPANKKQLSPTRAQEVVDLIVARGYKVLQLGLTTEVKLVNTLRVDNDYFNMIRDMLSCKALVTTDSGTAWGASCYDHPTLGLYSHSYYGKDRVKAIQPLNPNAIYLDADNVNEIPLHYIEASLDSLL